MVEIIPYIDSSRSEWDNFISISKNGTFLFKRNYMEYHKDRFDDYSLLAKNKGKLVAVIPANKHGKIIYSHQGLTYGGVVSGIDMNPIIMDSLFLSLIERLKEQGIERLIIKRIPHIYERAPSEEDLYVFFRRRTKLIRRDLASAIFLPSRIPYERLRKRRIKIAKEAGVSVSESQDLSEFWGILSYNLKTKYGKDPVHTLEEIKYLKNSFPTNIRLYISKYKAEIVSGVLVYETDTVAHLQYSASTDLGRDISAEDPIIDFLIDSYSSNKSYLDFGISTENEGTDLNDHLLFYKEGFGARTVVYDFYEVNLLETY